MLGFQKCTIREIKNIIFIKNYNVSAKREEKFLIVFCINIRDSYKVHTYIYCMYKVYINYTQLSP